MKFPTIQILPSCQTRFANGYPWLYANEIEQSAATQKISPGQIVFVAYQGTCLGLGYYNRHSLISFRLLSRDPETIFDTDYFMERLQSALQLRNRFYLSPYYRLVHAEADGLPGLIIDRFDSVLVLQINTQGMEQLKTPLLAAIQIVFAPTTILLKQDSSVRALEQLPIAEPEMIGEALTHLTVIENHLLFKVDLTSTQKTGWFYDHRDNRILINTLAKGKTVLDYFCYSGGFSLQAAKAEATQVIGIDRSEIAIQNAKASATLNGLNDRCEFICRDVFEDMEIRIIKKEQYNLVILDPPAFIKSKKDFKVGLKGYEKLLTKAIQLVTKEGLLFIASCSYHLKENDLHYCLNRALSKNKREGRILRSLGAGFDHPQHPLLEESRYLKGFLVYLA